MGWGEKEKKRQQRKNILAPLLHIISFFRLPPFILHKIKNSAIVNFLSCEYLREFSKKIEAALMGYSGAWGKLIHEKNLKSKISWHCHFNNMRLTASYHLALSFIQEETASHQYRYFKVL